MNEPDPQATIRLSHDGQTVFLEWAANAPKVQINATDIDAIALMLRSYRMAMAPPVPTEPWVDGPYIDVQPDPAWYIEPEAMTGDPIMHLRHPGIGWLHFLLPRSESKHLAEGLTAAAVAAPPTDSQRPN